MNTVTIVGGGLSGCEAAWQLGDRGLRVRLVEMRPLEKTGAHRSDRLAEIVCSNSFKSVLPETASGLLKTELGILGCRLLETAGSARVPAGHALAVDREVFSEKVTDAIENHPNIAVERRRHDDVNLSLPAIIATGPLTAQPLSDALQDHCSKEHLHFFDAIAPSVETESIDTSVFYRASRYGKGGADYLNVPLTEDEYKGLIGKIREAERVRPHAFEKPKYFEACLPIEEMASRGEDTARFGPLRPRGLADPRTGKEPYAVIQLRQESRSGGLLGLVGFQTRMTYGAQKEIVRSLPGFRNARILRYGSIHRNIFLDNPSVCDRYQRDRKTRGLFYAGQICGVEGYVECITSGLVAALSVFADSLGRPLPPFPSETMTGALMEHIHTPSRRFQPMNANMGLLPARERVRGPRKDRYLQASQRATVAMQSYRDEHSWLYETGPTPGSSS